MVGRAAQQPMMMLNQLGFEAVEPMRDPCWLSQGVNDFWGTSRAKS
jgi:hypothetical protein